MGFSFEIFTLKSCRRKHIVGPLLADQSETTFQK
jgi:hypothetical protein